MRSDYNTERHCHDCINRRENSLAAIKKCTKLTYLLCGGGILAIAAYIMVGILLIGYSHRIIETEIFLKGSSDLLLDMDFVLFYGSIGGLAAIAALAFFADMSHSRSFCIGLIFGFPIMAVFAVVCLVTGQKFMIIYIVMLIYSVIMTAVQFRVLRALDELHALKSEPGYPHFNPALFTVKASVSADEWSTMTDDERLMAERDGHYRQW